MPHARLSPEHMTGDLARLRAALGGQEVNDAIAAIWEMAVDALALSDETATVLMVNAAYLDLYGYAADEVVGQNFAVIFPPEQRDSANEGYQAVFHGPVSPPPFDAVVRRRDGTERVVEARVWFVTDAAGRRTGMVNAIRDITARTRAEEAARLAEAERLQLYESEQAARAEAEAALRKRDEFLATISHDLLNPLAAIKGSAQLIRRRAARANVDASLALVELAESIDAMADQMSAQVGDLLDVAREQSGQALDLVRQPVDLVPLVREVLTAYEEPLAGHPVRFECDEPAVVGHWDRVRVRRALANLVLNAGKYSPADAEIVVRVARESGGERTLARIEVQDRGIGISPADLPHVLERFFRSSKVVGSVAGNGLGLASVRNIVELHGGTIDIESEEGTGSTFTVRLPL